MPYKPTKTEQTDFLESFEGFPLDDSRDGDETSDVSSAHLDGDESSEESGSNNLQESFPFMEDIREDFVPEPSKLQEKFKTIQPASTLRIGGVSSGHGPGVVLGDRFEGEEASGEYDCQVLPGDSWWPEQIAKIKQPA